MSGLDDGDLAAFAESIELAVVATYRGALGTTLLTQDATAAITRFVAHHQAHADAFGEVAGFKAFHRANPKLTAALLPLLRNAVDQRALLTLAVDVENKLAATYLTLADTLVTPSALHLMATTLPVENEHAVLLGALLKKTPKELVPQSIATKDGSIDPATYPPG